MGKILNKTCEVWQLVGMVYKMKWFNVINKERRSKGVVRKHPIGSIDKI